MATTPTYSWPIPDDTDLVKDGAEAIRDLGNAIDTTVGGLGSGLVHINTTSFSAVASQSINDVFSATYDFYKVFLTFTGSNQNEAVRFRFRASGTDATSSNYAQQLLRGASSTASAGLNSTLSSFPLSVVRTNGVSQEIFIANPALVKTSDLYSTYFGETQMTVHGNKFTLTTAFDGFTIFPDVGTITGTLRVFGIQN